jgi:DNA-binding IclR family transcriptional regulator
MVGRSSSSPKRTKRVTATDRIPPSRYATPALDKGLDILELLSRQREGLTKSEVARALNRSVSEIFRMLLCLEQRAYISIASGDRYVLSLRLFQLVQEHPPTERLLSEAMPRMHTLAEKTQQSCHLGVLDGARVVILAQTNSSTSTGFYVKPGSSVDLMEAATGQVILAYLPKEAQDRVLAEWKKETGGVIASDLNRRLAKIRQRGYEKRASYQVRGVTNISYPVLGVGGRAIAALTVPYILRIRESPQMDDVEKAIAATAQELSAAMGRT